jgi:hypothetical protein
MPAGATSTFCITDANLAAWTSGAPPSITAAMQRNVVQFNTGSSCPTGYTQLTVVVGGAGSQPTLVAFETQLPPTSNLAWIFALGFLAAFSTARVVSMTIRAALDLARN